MHELISKYKHWRFKNTFFLVVGLIVFFYFADTPVIKNTITGIGDLGYVGAFIVGIFFVSTFTVAPATVVLFHLAKELTPLEVALFAGLGSVLGDYLIFRFMKDRVFEEITPVFKRLGGLRLAHLLATPYFAWLAPVFGAIIIASPLPDEVGITLLGISKLKNWQFLTLSLILNSIGILAIILLAQIL